MSSTITISVITIFILAVFSYFMWQQIKNNNKEQNTLQDLIDQLEFNNKNSSYQSFDGHYLEPSTITTLGEGQIILTVPDGKRRSTDDEYLINLYIKSSYNSCSQKSFKYGYVSLDALKYVMKRNVRFLDFEIFSINNEPVVALSYSNGGLIKGSYNHLNLTDVLDTVYKVNKKINTDDPLFINFRIKTNKIDVINKMGKIIQKAFKGTLYSGGGGGGDSSSSGTVEDSRGSNLLTGIPGGFWDKNNNNSKCNNINCDLGRLQYKDVKGSVIILVECNYLTHLSKAPELEEIAHVCYSINSDGGFNQNFKAYRDDSGDSCDANVPQFSEPSILTAVFPKDEEDTCIQMRYFEGNNHNNNNCYLNGINFVAMCWTEKLEYPTALYRYDQLFYGGNTQTYDYKTDRSYGIVLKEVAKRTETLGARLSTNSAPPPVSHNLNKQRSFGGIFGNAIDATL